MEIKSESKTDETKMSKINVSVTFIKLMLKISESYVGVQIPWHVITSDHRNSEIAQYSI